MEPCYCLLLVSCGVDFGSSFHNVEFSEVGSVKVKDNSNYHRWFNVAVHKKHRQLIEDARHLFRKVSGDPSAGYSEMIAHACQLVVRECEDKMRKDLGE